MKLRPIRFLGTFAAIALSQAATAATYHWNGSTTGNLGGVSNTWDATSPNWTGTGTNWPTTSTTDDDAVFGGAAGTVTIATGGVTANDLSFNTTGYIIGGAGLTLDGITSILTTGPGAAATISSVISGGASPTKQGGGTLTLSGANTFTGSVYIKEGILRAGNGAALGSNIDGTTIEPGATLDVNGQNLGTEIVTVSGTGVDGNGAIINTGGQQINAFGRLVLAGDTTFGGPNRWDLRNSTPTFDMAGHTLTKTGANYLGLIDADVSNAGNVVINQGELSLTFVSSFGGVDATNTITVNSGATLSFYQSSPVHGSTLNLNGGSTLRGEYNNSATQNTWAGPVNVTGEVTLRADAVLNLDNSVSGTANLTKIGNGAATISASGSLTHIGNLTVNAGTLTVNGPLAHTGGITLNAGTLNTNGTLTQNGDVTVNGGTLNVAGTGSFTGAVRLNGGTLALNYATDDNSKLPDDKALTLAGGTLTLGGAAHNEVVASTTLAANTSSTVGSSGHTGLLGMKTITPEAGASVNFNASLIATTDNLNTHGVLGAWATVAGNDWAVNDTNAADGAVKAYDGYVFTFEIADDAALYQNKHVTAIP